MILYLKQLITFGRVEYSYREKKHFLAEQTTKIRLETYRVLPQLLILTLKNYPSSEVILAHKHK